MAVPDCCGNRSPLGAYWAGKGAGVGWEGKGEVGKVVSRVGWGRKGWMVQWQRGREGLISPLACQSAPSESCSCAGHLLARAPGLLRHFSWGFPFP